MVHVEDFIDLEKVQIYNFVVMSASFLPDRAQILLEEIASALQRLLSCAWIEGLQDYGTLIFLPFFDNLFLGS